MRPVEILVDSDALRANISRTAQPVVIPQRYRPLVEVVDRYLGVQGPLTDTLTEYFHAYRNIDLLVDGFQVILLRNWSYFERSEKRAESFSLLSKLVLDLLDARLTAQQASLLLRQLLTWCAAVLSGPYGDAYDKPLLKVADCLSRFVPRQTLAALERDTLLRNLVRLSSGRPKLSAAFSELYRSLLLLGYRRAAQRLPVPEWAMSEEAELTDRSAVASGFSNLTQDQVGALIARAQHASTDELLSAELPTFSGIVDQAIDEVFRIGNLEDRFAVCLYFLKDDTLGYRQNEVMVDLLAVVRQLMGPHGNMDVEGVLSRLTRFFRARDNQFLLMRFQCYEAIGVAIGEASNAAAADHLIEDVLYWRFQYPDIQGATDEWETVVNPYHLPKIRCWMHIIESNPALYERLAAALNVQLRLGGVYIADTDLFQRDVTRFLNADIAPIYFVAKQLLRAFPVYFNDVGAEGELRAVSTELDEICGRHDSLLHFLRKQSHAESSNRLVVFARAVLDYWMTLELSGLEPYLSVNALAAVRSERDWAKEPHEVLLALQSVLCAPTAATDTHAFLDCLIQTSPSALEEALAGVPGSIGAHSQGSRRVILMVRTHQLLTQKYSLSADDVSQAVGRHLRLEAATRSAFAKALGAWQKKPSPSTRERLLDSALDVLKELKAVVLSPSPSVAVENIYQKRHIAAGIPSMYGTYTEPKFDALGLSFRVENLVACLLEDLVAEGVDPYVTRDSLRRMAVAIRRFESALSADGVDSRNLAANIRLLESSFSSQNFTFHQYQNVFQFIAGSVAELSRNSILSHDQVLHTVLEHDPRQCEARGMSLDAVAEMVLREVLVSALGMQTLDRYVSAAVRQMSTLTGRLSNPALTRMMNYDPERLVSPIHEAKPGTDDQMTLGFKGLGLKQMASYDHQVPPGFILTTELFGAMPAMAHRPLYDDTLQRLDAAIGRLQRETGLRLGDPTRLLTLSIRSGAAISLPGLMTTFVNVGLNDRLAEALSKRKGFEWAAWDSYRRFLQTWAMASGIKRDVFDDLMTACKKRNDVERKSELSPEAMQKLAGDYRRQANALGVRFVDDPFRQVVSCVRKVLSSWDSSEAKLYRRYLGLAAEWGTAVVIQRMVFGNLDKKSGSGVTFTRNPLEPYSSQVRLFGDFTVKSQGEDLVGGLVFPWPISEAQRVGSRTYKDIDHSLEKDFPLVYQALLDVARDLVARREHEPQEIEFTFESASGDDLYILQKRPMVHEQQDDAPYFDVSSPLFGPPVAVGMGVSGGAYSGRVAIDMEQIDRLLAEAPDDPILLLRPDTVPEDIAMITRVAGLLTARGGATSHAAVTAKRLGKTAVVDCRALEVLGHQGTGRLAEAELNPGDWLSIDGRTGNMFMGRLPLQKRAQLAQER
jgi:pyruvate,orthophosphate dikinase